MHTFFRWSREISEIEWGRSFSYIISALATKSYKIWKKVLVYWWTVKSWVNGPMTPVRPTGWIFYTRAIMIFSDCTMDRPQNKPQNCIYFLKPKGFGVEKSIGFWRIAVEIAEFWEVKRLWSIAVEFRLGPIHEKNELIQFTKNSKKVWIDSWIGNLLLNSTHVWPLSPKWIFERQTA